MTNSQKRLPTHTFLASLGRTVLRPGGKNNTQLVNDFDEKRTYFGHISVIARKPL